MDLRAGLHSFFDQEGIELFGVLPFSRCRVIHEGLLLRALPDARSVILCAVPYYTGKTSEARNISLYAVSKDYHLYIRALNERLIAFLSSALPCERFAGFGDHSPIDERHAAARAGLGVIGDNRLLITKKYGSYVFLAETLSTASPEVFSARETQEAGECLHCGECRKACPCAPGECASGVGQKKGELTEREKELVKKTGLAWGCDLCQTCCPLNAHIEKTPIPFFYEDRIAYLNAEILAGMDKRAFEERAFSWRGRAPLLRNLELFKEQK